MSTFVLVHGAWCWEKVMPLLEAAGHAVIVSDRTIGITAQRGMHERQRCETVISMDASPSPFFSAPEELAGHLASLA